MNADPSPGPQPEVINRQRKVKIDCSGYVDFARRALDAVEEADGLPFTVAFVSDVAMRKLNRDFRGKDSTTDVLSFPHFDAVEKDHADFLGDIAISVEVAARQAKENGLSLDEEIKQLILHGLLHLCGYDHETDKGEMSRYELKLRRRLKI